MRPFVPDASELDFRHYSVGGIAVNAFDRLVAGSINGKNDIESYDFFLMVRIFLSACLL